MISYYTAALLWSVCSRCWLFQCVIVRGKTKRWIVGSFGANLTAGLLFPFFCFFFDTHLNAITDEALSITCSQCLLRNFRLKKFYGSNCLKIFESCFTYWFSAWGTVTITFKPVVRFADGITQSNSKLYISIEWFFIFWRLTPHFGCIWPLVKAACLIM